MNLSEVHGGVALLAGTLCRVVDVETAEVTCTILALLCCGFVTGAGRTIGMLTWSGSRLFRDVTSFADALK